MDLGWVHSKCWDQQFLEEWAHPEKFQFALDAAFEKPVLPAQISSAEVELPFVTNAYHGAHCVYAFHKMARAAALGEHVNLRTRHLYHTHHCAHSIRTIKKDKFNVTGPGGVTFFRCSR